MSRTCARPTKPSGPQPEPRRFRPLGALLIFVLLPSLSATPAARAEERVAIQGLADAEGWNTGSDPNYLTRNEGDSGSVGRLRLWGFGDFSQRFQGFAMLAMEGGKATPTQETDYRVEQAYVRVLLGESRATILQAGKLIQPYGNFSKRYLSTSNPLIGTPMNYELSYPFGVQLNGSAGRFDYMVAVLDSPFWKQAYDSKPESYPRPALAAGVTPLVGFRLGGYATKGPYLSQISKSEDWLFPEDQLSDFEERAYGLDLQYSVAHFELNGDMSQASLEVPYAGTARGRVYYVEPKFTISPRWYVAARYERGNVPNAHWDFGTVWEARRDRIHDVEAGFGFRIDPRFLIKASYRAILDRASGPAEDDAVSVQFSYSFDVNSWFRRQQ
ncbi:MAG TPA: hypothetical protein VFW45_13865 [Candidatus Polarisedimenticolia bacterium]|nr:hypothetical protein [Candidatus Polarisedimenticolia bacterium]